MKNSTLADSIIDWISAHGANPDHEVAADLVVMSDDEILSRMQDDEETAGVSLLPKDFDEWDWSDACDEAREAFGVKLLEA